MEDQAKHPAELNAILAYYEALGQQVRRADVPAPEVPPVSEIEVVDGWVTWKGRPVWCSKMGVLVDSRPKARAEEWPLAESAWIATLEQRLSQLTLHAPADGIVLTDGLERLSGKVLQEGETLLEIGGDDGWRAALLVAERDVSRIRVGDPVQVELRAFGRVNSPEIRGQVLTVGAEPAPGAAGENRMFPVMVRLHRDDLEAVGLERLRRGYTASAKVVTRSERLIDLIWEYLLRRTERKQEVPAQAPAEKSPQPSPTP